jgi:16S rRNA (guanine527-N7)-methyltransferase
MISRGRTRAPSPGFSRRSRSGERGDDDAGGSANKPGDGTPSHRDSGSAGLDLEDRKRALAMVDVSPETVTRLDRFVELLLTWQRHTNLIARSTIPSLWTRHVADSLQLLDLVEAPYARPTVWLDLGSGGGFPGVVIACALADVPGAQVHMVESILKKATFLREAIRETKAPGIVHDTRIESLTRTFDAAAVDYVTARALAPLPELLKLVFPFVKKGAKALLLKGQDLDRELTESTKHWHIEAETVPSRTSKAGRILLVHALSQQTAKLSAPSVPTSASKGRHQERGDRMKASSRQEP